MRCRSVHVPGRRAAARRLASAIESRGTHAEAVEGLLRRSADDVQARVAHRRRLRARCWHDQRMGDGHEPDDLHPEHPCPVRVGARVRARSGPRGRQRRGGRGLDRPFRASDGLQLRSSSLVGIGELSSARKLGKGEVRSTGMWVCSPKRNSKPRASASRPSFVGSSVRSVCRRKTPQCTKRQRLPPTVFGSPRPRTAMMSRMISEVPP